LLLVQPLRDVGPQVARGGRNGPSPHATGGAVVMFRSLFDPRLLAAVTLAVLLLGCGSASQPPGANETGTTQVGVTLEEGERALGVSPDGGTLATMAATGKVRLRDLPSGRILGEGDGSERDSRRAMFSSDGKRFAVVYDTHRLDRAPFVIQI